MNVCRICGNSDNNLLHNAREMMFGTKEEFDYIECVNCGCLQIKEIPNDPAQYYTKDNYYSYLHDEIGKVKLYAKKLLASHILKKESFIGFLLEKTFKTPFDRKWFELTDTNFASSILDIGCGSGVLLKNLQIAGFNNLTGADPYINKDILHGDGLIIYKKHIDELSGKYDLIMLHHSFEHFPEPLESLQNMEKILAPAGHILLRIPVFPSYAWTKYGTSWVQLDAPRHFYLHSLKSIQILARKVNMEIKHIFYDSTEFQFWGSEQYLRDIPLTSTKSYAVSKRKSIFSSKQIKKFRSQATELNQLHQGDSACIILSRTDSPPTPSS